MSILDKKVVAVDFDGTLVFNNYPTIEYPNNLLINWIRRNRDKYIFILWTCRTGVQLENAINYLKEKHLLEFDYVNENVPELEALFGYSRKINADYYIDDRNVRSFKEIEDEFTN